MKKAWEEWAMGGTQYSSPELDSGGIEPKHVASGEKKAVHLSEAWASERRAWGLSMSDMGTLTCKIQWHLEYLLSSNTDHSAARAAVPRKEKKTACQLYP